MVVKEDKHALVARRFDGFGIIAADGRPNGSYRVGHKGLSRLAIDQKMKWKSTCDVCSSVVVRVYIQYTMHNQRQGY